MKEIYFFSFLIDILKKMLKKTCGDNRFDIYSGKKLYHINEVA